MLMNRHERCITNAFVMLMNMQERRITVAAALSHPYVDEGRLRYHTCMCQCCPNLPDGVRYTSDAEPVCSTPFHYVFEDELNSISRVKGLCCVLLC